MSSVPATLDFASSAANSSVLGARTIAPRPVNETDTGDPRRCPAGFSVQTTGRTARGGRIRRDGNWLLVCGQRVSEFCGEGDFGRGPKQTSADGTSLVKRIAREGWRRRL